MVAKFNIRSHIRKLIPTSIGSLLIQPGTARIEQSRWDEEYASGKWEHLTGVFEVPRYSVMAGYCHHLIGKENPASILDIGCGNGLLYHWLTLNGIAIHYVGIDLSRAAIDQAKSRYTLDHLKHKGSVYFDVADAENFIPKENKKFDLIILNEMLYYINDPEKLIERCLSFLSPGGVLIISMWRSPRAVVSWRRVASLLNVLDEVRLRRPNTDIGLGNSEWHIRLCSPQ